MSPYPSAPPLASLGLCLLALLSLSCAPAASPLAGANANQGGLRSLSTHDSTRSKDADELLESAETQRLQEALEAALSAAAPAGSPAEAEAKAKGHLKALASPTLMVQVQAQRLAGGGLQLQAQAQRSEGPMVAQAQAQLRFRRALPDGRWTR